MKTPPQQPPITRKGQAALSNGKIQLSQDVIRLANQLHYRTTDDEQKQIHWALREIISALEGQRCPTCNEDLTGLLVMSPVPEGNQAGRESELQPKAESGATLDNYGG